MSNPTPTPNAVESEEAVIGSVLIDPTVFRSANLKAGEFWDTRHGAIWQTFTEMNTAGTPIDLLTVQTELDRRGAGVGAGYLTKLVGYTPTPYNIGAYAGEVRQAAVARALLQQASQLAVAAYALDLTKAGAVLDAARGVLTGSASGTAQTMAEIAAEEFDRYSDPAQMGRNFQKTFIVPLDVALGGGLNLGTQTTVMSRPGMGKTALLCQIADEVSYNGGVVVFGSKEMSKRELLDRMAARRSKVNLQRWRQGEATEDERARMSEALVHLMHRTGLFVDDKRTQTTGEFWAECARVREMAGRLDLIIADHLRLFSDTADNETHRLGRISWAFKQMAGELNCRSIVAAQLSRGVEGQADKRPDLKDLRDSGEIEENADNVIGIYREKYYDPKANMLAELLIRKCRDGARGDKAEMVYQERYMGFERKAVEA